MTETATTATAVAISLPSLPLTTVDNLFSITHQFIDQYRTTIFAFTGTVMAAWLYNRYWVNRKFYPSMQLMTGKTVLITDGHIGVGYETAKDLLRRGARVIITCSDLYHGRESVRQLRIETECDEKSIRVMECDLCSLDSVREFAKFYYAEEQRLDVLICNATRMWSTNVVTKDGWNTLIQANYLGHFLLTNLLLDKLKQCRPSRIINVSSNAHRIIQTIDWSDVFTQFNNYRYFGAYSTAKLFQILSAYKLKRDLLRSEGINTFAVTPGWVWTSNRLSLIETFGFYPFLIIYPILRLLKIAFAKTAKTGSRTTIFCAVEPALENSGALFFERCQFDLPSWLCTDDEYADRLWKLSSQVVQL